MTDIVTHKIFEELLEEGVSDEEEVEVKEEWKNLDEIWKQTKYTHSGN